MTLNDFAQTISTNEKIKVTVMRGSKQIISYLAPGYEGLSSELLGSTVVKVVVVSAVSFIVHLESE